MASAQATEEEREQVAEAASEQAAEATELKREKINIEFSWLLERLPPRLLVRIK